MLDGMIIFSSQYHYHLMELPTIQAEIAEDSIFTYFSHFNNHFTVEHIHVPKCQINIEPGMTIRLAYPLKDEIKFVIGHPDASIMLEKYLPNYSDVGIVKETHIITLKEGTIVTPSSGIKQRLVEDLQVNMTSNSLIVLKPGTRLISCKDFQSYILEQDHSACIVFREK
jgi:hypothetical protein